MPIDVKEKDIKQCQGPTGTEAKSPIEMFSREIDGIVQETVCRYLHRDNHCEISREEPKEKCPKLPVWK